MYSARARSSTVTARNLQDWSDRDDARPVPARRTLRPAAALRCTGAPQLDVGAQRFFSRIVDGGRLWRGKWPLKGTTGSRVRIASSASGAIGCENSDPWPKVQCSS